MTNAPNPAATIAPARASPSCGPPSSARDLAVGDDVTEVGRQLHAEGHREPDRIEVVQFVQHPAEACGPGDPDRGAERQRSADADEQRVLRGVPLEVRSRPEKIA